MRINDVLSTQSVSIGESVFFVSEKAQESNSTHINENASSNKMFSQKKMSVLVVDDDRQVTRFLSETLHSKDDNIIVNVANDGLSSPGILKIQSPFL